MLEQVAQRIGRAHALRKRQPQRGAVELQFEPFRVASDAAPFPVGSAEELGGIEPHRVPVIAVHVGKNRGLGREELGGVAGLGQNVARLKVDDAAETSDQMRGLERHQIEGEVAKAREHLRLRLAIEIAAARLRVLRGSGGSHEHDAGPLQGIARLALVDHERDARIGENVLGVHGKARDQQQRRTVGRGRDIDQRAVGIARGGHQRRQCPRAALAQKLLGGGRGVEIRGGLHLDSPLKGVTKRLRLSGAGRAHGARGNWALARNAGASYASNPFDESRVCQGFATFQPCFGGFKSPGRMQG